MYYCNSFTSSQQDLKLDQLSFGLQLTLQGDHVGWRVVDKNGTLHEKNSLVTNRGTSVFFMPTNVAAVTLAANRKYRLESVKLGVTNIPTFLHDLQWSYTILSVISK